MECTDDLVPASRQYVSELIARLRSAYPDAHCELNYETPIQLLVATILSAQCTDQRVNMTTPALFARYPTTEALAAADPSDLEELVRPTGFYRQKARYIREAAHRILTEYGGRIPSEMDDLLTLSGVAVAKNVSWERLVSALQGHSAALVVKVAQDAAKAAVLSGEKTVEDKHLRLASTELHRHTPDTLH